MAQWKKLIVSGALAELGNLEVDNHVSASVISGSFFGDGSGITNLPIGTQVFNQITGDISITEGGVADIEPAVVTGREISSSIAGAGLLGGYDLATSTFAPLSVDSGSIFGAVTGDLSFTDATASLTADSVDEFNISSSIAGTGLSGGSGTALSVDYGSTAGTAAQGNTAVTFAGTANEIELSTNTFSTVGGGGNVTIGLPDDVTIAGTLTAATGSVTGDLSVGGNLAVSGDLTYVNTTNLVVQDPFILLNSGSNGSVQGDSGIIFGGSEDTANEGNLLFWDKSYDTDKGRLGVATNIGQDHTGNISDSDRSYYVGGVFEGSEADAATAEANLVGNIRVESEEIYIWV
jgi:hypothetical protein